MCICFYIVLFSSFISFFFFSSIISFLFFYVLYSTLGSFFLFFFFFKQKTAYEMRISDWSSDVCSSDLLATPREHIGGMTGAPSKPNRRTASMIRVDQAGEYGATRIYAGQLAVMGDRHPMAREIAHMAEQEERHRRFFDAMIAKRGVRPTALQPLWNVAGFALGAATAAMGPRAAMACTAAVETEIDRHYQHQLDELGDRDPEQIGRAHV